MESRSKRISDTNGRILAGRRDVSIRSAMDIDVKRKVSFILSFYTLFR